MDKRGVSELIATVLLIAMTVAAAGVIYSFVRPIVVGNLEGAQKCSNAELDILEAGDTCYDSATGQILIEIARGNKDFELSGIQVVIEGGKTSGVLIKENGTDSNVREYSQTAISLPGRDEARVYVINTQALGITTPSSASIAALVKVNDKENLCSSIDKVSLGSCTSTSLCIPNCENKECGGDRCDGSCGSCSGGTTCNSTGQCVCIPSCYGKQCGDDGCGGNCGDCNLGYACVINQCQENWTYEYNANSVPAASSPPWTFRPWRSLNYGCSQSASGILLSSVQTGTYFGVPYNGSCSYNLSNINIPTNPSAGYTIEAKIYLPASVDQNTRGQVELISYDGVYITNLLLGCNQLSCYSRLNGYTFSSTTNPPIYWHTYRIIRKGEYVNLTIDGIQKSYRKITDSSGLKQLNYTVSTWLSGSLSYYAIQLDYLKYRPGI